MRISDWSSDVCSSDLQQTPLWPRAAPNMEDVKLPPEYSETATNPKRFAGRPVTGVFNVTVPTLTVFPAKQPGNGAAMLVFPGGGFRSEEHTSELQSLMSISYADFCLKQKKKIRKTTVD